MKEYKIIASCEDSCGWEDGIKAESFADAIETARQWVISGNFYDFSILDVIDCEDEECIMCIDKDGFVFEPVRF